MATSESQVPKREPTPTPTPSITLIPQKRAAEENAPAVSSPLNPEGKWLRTPHKEDSPAVMVRDKASRTKKDSLKKRESKAAAATPTGTPGGNGDSPRGTPGPGRSKKGLGDTAGTTILAEASPLRSLMIIPRPSDFEPAKGPIFTHHRDLPNPDGDLISFHETSEHARNKKNYHYVYSIADPRFPSSRFFRQTEPEPYGPHLNFLDAAQDLFFDKSATHVTTDKGFRMARANVSAREGRWYWECKITRGILRDEANDLPHHTTTTTSNSNSNNKPHSEGHGHVRVGWARKEASLDAPVGFDAYSYGFRDVHGEKVHMSRPKPFLPAGEAFVEGDVIGLEIQLPSERLHRKVVTGSYNPAVDDDEHEVGGVVMSATGEGGVGVGGGGGVRGGVEEILRAPNIVRDRLIARAYFEKAAWHTTKELEDLMNPSPVVSTTARNADTMPGNNNNSNMGNGNRKPGSQVGGGGGAASSAGDAPNPNHPIPALRTLPGSAIRIYKNGKLMGEPFTNLLSFLPPASRPAPTANGAREGFDDGVVGYFPAVSVFRGGAAEVNFGPDFWFPPPGLFEMEVEVEGAGVGCDDATTEMRGMPGIDVICAEEVEDEEEEENLEKELVMEDDDGDVDMITCHVDEDDVEPVEKEENVTINGEQDMAAVVMDGGKVDARIETTIVPSPPPPPPPPPPSGQNPTCMTGTEAAVYDAKMARRSWKDRFDHARPMNVRYRDQIVEDIVYDLVDEVDFWMQDGGQVATSGLGGMKGLEIRELALAQDD